MIDIITDAIFIHNTHILF